MKTLLLSALFASTAVCAMAQTYNMEVTFTDGTTQTFPAENVAKVTFLQDGPAETFNILTEE